MGIVDVLGGENTDPLSLSIIAIGATGALLNAVGDGLSSGSGLAGAMIALEDLAIDMKQPMLGIIPIKCDKYSVTRRVDVSETMVVKAEGDGGNDKNFVTDNSAPHPREWKIHGYCDSLLPALETGIILKPTLLLQKKYLDEKTASRKAVAFKTTDGENVKVLVQVLDIIDDPKSTTKFEVSLTLKEFVPALALIGSAKSLTGAGASLAGAAALAGGLSTVMTLTAVALAVGQAAVSLAGTAASVGSIGIGEFFTGLGNAVLGRIDTKRLASYKEKPVGKPNSIVLTSNIALTFQKEYIVRAYVKPTNTATADKELEWDIVGADRTTVIPASLYFSIIYLANDKNNNNIIVKGGELETDGTEIYLRARVKSNPNITALSKIIVQAVDRTPVLLKSLVIAGNNIKLDVKEI